MFRLQGYPARQDNRLLDKVSRMRSIEIQVLSEFLFPLALLLATADQFAFFRGVK